MADNKLELATLRSGDMDNAMFKSYYNSRPEIAEKNLSIMCSSPNQAEGDISGCIYYGEVSQDNMRRIIGFLTLYPEFQKRTGVEFNTPVTDYYFATIINNMVSDGKVPRECRILSDQQLKDIHKLLSGGKYIDYSQYVIGGDHSKQKVKYIKCKVKMDFLNSDIELKVPVKKNLFGATFRLANEKSTTAPAIMSFAEDPDANEYVLPTSIWSAWVDELVSKRPTPNFLAVEAKTLQFYIKPQPKHFREALSANGMAKGLDILNAYDADFNGYHELVIKCDPETIKELKEEVANRSSHFTWEGHSGGINVLKHNGGRFYVVDKSGDTLAVYTTV